LSNDAPAATEAIEAALDAAPLAEVMDKTVLPAMRLAARDHKAKKIDEEKTESLRQTIVAVGEFIVSESAKTPDSRNAHETPVHCARVVVVPAHGAIDILLAPLIAALVAQNTDCDCRAVEHTSGMMALSSLREDGTRTDKETIVISTVGGVSRRQLRFLARRASLSFPNARVLVCDWGAAAAEAIEPDGALPANVIECSRFAQALDLLRLTPKGESLAAPTISPPFAPISEATA
jgi:hypothetical protein